MKAIEPCDLKLKLFLNDDLEVWECYTHRDLFLADGFVKECHLAQGLRLFMDSVEERKNNRLDGVLQADT